MDCQQQNTCAGCGQNACCASCGQPREIRLRRREADLLLRFAEVPFLPAARFSLRRLDGPAQEGDSLAPVFLCTPSDSLAAVCETAAVLERLAALRLISVSYTEPLSHYNYAEYVNAPSFTEFCARSSGIAVPEIENGSMALTAPGQEVIDDLELYALPRSENL